MSDTTTIFSKLKLNGLDTHVAKLWADEFLDVSNSRSKHASIEDFREFGITIKSINQHAKVVSFLGGRIKLLDILPDMWQKRIAAHWSFGRILSILTNGEVSIDPLVVPDWVFAYAKEIPNLSRSKNTEKAIVNG